MRILTFALLALIAITACFAAEEDVIVLTDANFDEIVNKEEFILIEFYAPWCGHCKALAPEYETAATALKEKNIPLVKVDCTEEADLCKDHDVQGYPTIKVFRGLDNVSPYGGQRKSDALVVQSVLCRAIS